MRLNARFWRNVTLIALVHTVALIALLRWAGASKIASPQEITWLSTGGEASAIADTAKTECHPGEKEIARYRDANEGKEKRSEASGNKRRT